MKNSRDIKISIAKENTFLGKIFRVILVLFLKPIIKLFWIKNVKGKKNLPSNGSFIIAANHQSYFDFISLVAVLPFHLTFLAAEKFYTSKFWKPIMEYTGQIKVEREAEDKSEAVKKALMILKSGKVLAIFPQGTRSRNNKIEKTFTGVARLAIEAKVAVVPIGIKGAFEVMPPQAKKPKIKKIIEINIGLPMEFSKYYNANKWPALYRNITNKIMSEIGKLAGKDYLGE